MEKNISFSVLMSVYYKEKPERLRYAIDSIINQTLLPNEFVIVEDGKLTEKLEKILDGYKEKYNWIKIIKLPQNLGLGLALREGVKACNYKYIARMDSDDYSRPDRFEKQINYLKNNPDLDLLGGNIAEYDENMEKVLSIRKVPSGLENIKKFAKTRNPFNHVSVVFSKSVVLECNNYESMLFFEDYYLWCKLISSNCNVNNIDEILVDVRARRRYAKSQSRN